MTSSPAVTTATFEPRQVPSEALPRRVAEPYFFATAEVRAAGAPVTLAAGAAALLEVGVGVEFDEVAGSDDGAVDSSAEQAATASARAVAVAEVRAKGGLTPPP